MKVVKVGNPRPKKWRGECRHCQSVIEALESEITVEWDQREGSWARDKCLVCQKEIFLYPRNK